MESIFSCKIYHETFYNSIVKSSFKVSQVNLEAACSNQPQNYTILSGKREIEIENCDLEETDEDLKSFLQDEVGLGNSEISKVCADECTDPEICSNCFDVNEKMSEIEFWHQEHPQQSLFDPQSNKCAIVQNEFQSCAAVYNVKRQEDIKKGIYYIKLKINIKTIYLLRLI